jgi:hypothetical protein
VPDEAVTELAPAVTLFGDWARSGENTKKMEIAARKAIGIRLIAIPPVAIRPFPIRKPLCLIADVNMSGYCNRRRSAKQAQNALTA